MYFLYKKLPTDSHTALLILFNEFSIATLTKAGNTSEEVFTNTMKLYDVNILVVFHVP
ncbi:hypothetical protein NMT12_60003 [metagenome]